MKKKILVVCQYYKPEPFRISDLCEELVRHGHEVQVVTGYPNYPEGILYDGYGKGKHIDETVEGVKIHRCYTVPRQTGMVRRLLNYYSYPASAKRYVLSDACKASDGSDFDVVFCNQLSPVMMAEPALAYSRKHHVPTVLYCLDLWPESLIAGGVTRSSPLYRFFHLTSGNIYRRADKILITSRMFADYFQKEFGIPASKIHYLPQYAEGLFEPLPPKQENGTFDFMFAGNIGAVQSVETILNAARQLQSEPVRFHIVGGGTDLERLQSAAAELSNITFYGRKPLEEMPAYYSMADAMLVTLAADPVLSLTLPGKVQSYMAVGKPIIGAIDGEAKAVIEASGCGLCGSAEDAEALAENIRRFIAPETQRAAMGRNARAYYEENFRQALFTDRLESHL